MKHLIWFKKKEGQPHSVLVSDGKLMVFQSFFCDDIQYSTTVECTGFWSWLTEIHKTQTELCGNSCCIIETENGVILENIFWDIASKIIVSKDELISSIELWAEFCKDSQERCIEFKSLRFID
jgi:hypothetical protein